MVEMMMLFFWVLNLCRFTVDTNVLKKHSPIFSPEIKHWYLSINLHVIKNQKNIVKR
jgi:hypothetical protein